ncbi:winged helix-turn-helix transcriptional regulator [Ralstonia solanacearum]|uniref:winged helix-turn-helix transcriptional regulator n=1 Tax=Ralstonia solanacearum TaxID=305 RepID=UPI0006DD15FA|nr:helix-turn-helix domain-containing protein [Ralstonia solanacearum]MCL9846069.1 helix-turn-helix transcriptional regulator [Ralstonia solanacearum]MDC6253912.1 helix-turn-helix domain-containing protein [Ralstonia solanacearum]MDC6258585.1 helix-turn-helix domain-containing protein [Ralstonia solanacearum]MDC6303394.1 helix-turn-helix domain-containing protein [Ralstonia solanacearum]
MNSNVPTPDNKDSLAARLSRGDVLSAACPAREVLSDVTSRWGVLVLIALRSGTFRYSALRRRIGGVSEKMLAQTLQALELDGFVKRVSLPVVPPHVEYSLTAMGEEVSQRVEGLTSWIETNLPMVLAARGASSRTKG